MENCSGVIACAIMRSGDRAKLVFSSRDFAKVVIFESITSEIQVGSSSHCPVFGTS